MLPDIKIRTLIGSGIKTYLPSIAKVRYQVLREIPLFQCWQLEDELSYLRHLSRSKDAIAVIVFDQSKIVGVSTGMPLAEEIPSLQQPFTKQMLPIEEYYYFGLSALLKPYRGRGLYHHFFARREEHLRQLKRFTKICFTSIAPSSPLPTELHNLATFWKKQGYVEHPELTCHYPLLNYPEGIPLKFWIKEFSLAPASEQNTREAIYSSAQLLTEHL